MTRNPVRLAKAGRLALTLLLAVPTLAAGAAAGPYNGPATVATPATPDSNFVQLKQISGFTGQLALSVSDGAYAPVGSGFNKLIKLRFSVDCPAGYRVDKAGIRVRGADVQNYDFELVSTGDLPSSQSSWEQVFEQEPWDFDAVVTEGAAALAAAGNHAPVYVSLDDALDSRTEFYGWCKPSDPFSGQTAIYYDSAEDNGHLRPMTRVRYTLHHGIAVAPVGALKLAPAAEPAQTGTRLQRRGGAQAAAPAAPAPSLRTRPCPYDCPPPAPRRLQLTN